MRRVFLTILVLFAIVSLNAGAYPTKQQETNKTVIPLEKWERNKRVDKKVYKIADKLEYICKKNKDDYEAIGWSPTAAKLYFELGKIMKESGAYALPPIYEIAKDKKRSIVLRIMMSDALADSKNPAGVRAVIGFLLDKGESERFRVNAADMLGRIKDTTATTALIETMEDKSNPEKVRWEAVRSVGEIRDEDAIPHLWSLLINDENEEIRAIAAMSLGCMGNKIRDRAGELIEIFNNEKSGLVKDKLIWTLISTKDERVIPILVKWKHTPIAIEGLKVIGGPEAKEALLELLKDKDEGVRFDAAKTLIKMRDKSVIPKIEKILPSLEVYYRDMVSDSLNKLREMNNK